MPLIKYFRKKHTWGIEIKTCGYYHAAPKSSYPPTGHPDQYRFKWRSGRKLAGFHIIYFPSGSGTVETKHFKDETINPGDALFIYENDWHRYKPTASTGWEEYWIGFDGSYFRDHILKDVFPQKRSYIKHI